MTTSTDTPSTPPWGDDFDADRAWTLLQNVRGDLAKAKDDLTAERQARETAESALKDADPEGKLTAAEKRAADAERSLWTERALRKHEIDEELVEFLTGDTEEAILAKAEKLSKVRKPETEEPKDGDKPKDGEPGTGSEIDLQSRPAPTLTPGHGGDSPEPNDLDAIAAATRKARH
jgi:hypothetical protein